MRFFSMCWIILGHTSKLFGILFFIINLGIILLLVSWNPAYYFELVGTLGGQILVNSYYAVDTFFFQSGLLLSYLWFRAYKRDPNQVNSTRSWLMFYVHRLLRYEFYEFEWFSHLRLSPAYFVVIAFYTFVFTSFVAQFPVISLLKKFKVFSCFSDFLLGQGNVNRSIFITFSI
jgi:peptidoglycan/LPS O-acetylase OafA/YrhL